MNTIILSLPKYYELMDSIDNDADWYQSDKWYQPDRDRFKEYYKCDTKISSTRVDCRAMIDLTFATEADLLWFKLKYL